jgi:hypothetical protein
MLKRRVGNLIARSKEVDYKMFKKWARTAPALLMVGVLLFATSAPAVAAPSTGDTQADQIRAEIEDLRKFLDTASEEQLPDKLGVQGLLNSVLGRPLFWGLLGQKNPLSCHVVDKLTLLLEHIQRLQEKHPSPTLEELYTRIWTLRNDILLNIPGGCPGFENIGSEPKTGIKTSDNKQLSFAVSFSLPTLTTAKGNGQTFTQVHMTGIENAVGTPGEPAVPKWRKLIALPEGAKPVIKMAQANEGETLRLNLVPFQEQAVDQEAPPPKDDGIPPQPPEKTFADKPFQINEETYKTDRFTPPDPCKITPMGQYRDVQMAQLECATAKYNPVSDQYVLNRNIDIQIAFEGGADNFITDRTFASFESNAKLTTEATLNSDVLSKYVKHIDISALPCFGEELLILTHQNFNAAAQTLATHKRNKGISTSVFNVGSGIASRDTAEEIDDFIENRYDECAVRPSYVLLLGDAEFIPTFYPAGMPDDAGTDFPYSNYVQILFDAFFPDFGTGRIPVDTLAQANTVVDKITSYEADPPFLGIVGGGAPYYTTVGLASQFQCCRMNGNGTPLNNQAGTDQRAFIETTELVRDELLDRGYDAPRIYTETVDNGGYCIQENASGDCIDTQDPYNGSTTPRRYYNGSLLPAGIGAGSGFAWNGDTADISSAWNAGRFLFLHRDHGWPGGWANPGFSTTNVDNLSNGELLPVVFSVNCASGLFDNETAGGIYDTTNGGVYFAERALRKSDGGAIGVIGDTRNSPTWANNALTRGFFDAVWPNTVPSHGGNTSHKRLGDILNWGKIYLAGQVGIGQTAGSISIDDMGYEYHIWHVIGDPTLEMWTHNPHQLVLPPNFSTEATRLGERIHYKQDGATITLLQAGERGEMRSIGRAIVKDGVADMEYFQKPDPEAPRIYSASKADSASVRLVEDGQDSPPTSPR